MKKFKKMVASMVLSVSLIGTIGTATYAMTTYGYYNISTITKTGIRVWAYEESGYRSASGKVKEGKRSSGWKTGRDVTVTINNNPFETSKTYHKYNK